MIPPTRYIDAGPGVPLANPQAAMAQGEAMARMGETIQRVGAMGFEIAEKVRKIDEGRKITALFANMEKEASDFSLSLMKREDTEAWGTEYQQKSEAWKQAAKEQKLSPEAMAEFEDRFLRWDTRNRIGFETQAANKAVELGRATLANSQEFHLSQRNYAAAEEDLAMAHRTGLISTPERDKVLSEIQKRERHDGILDEINADPRGWAERNPADKPPADYDPVKWRQMNDYAKGAARDNDSAMADKVLDGIVTGDVTTPEQIEAKTPGMRPADRQKLINALGDWNAEGAKARRADPAVIDATVGDFYAKLADWQPDPEGEDPAGVELKTMVKSLPEGHPLREKMLESMNAREKRIDTEIKTKADQMVESVKQAGERGDFGNLKKPEGGRLETRRKVEDGFLKDTAKLQALGFSEEQADTIREKAMQNTALGQKAFTDAWKDRPQGSVNASPFDVALADAVRLGNPYLPDTFKADLTPEQLASHEQATRAYGEALTEAAKWAKLNPNASDADMAKKIRELGSKSARIAPTTGPVKAPPPRPGATPQPGETSMLPKGGVKLSNYGYASDTTPDSNSARGIGHKDNKLIPGESAAISKSLAVRLGLEHGDKVKIETTKGDFTVYYHDTVPAYDKRTGPLPETIDIYRPKDGTNDWGGRVLKISKI